MRTAARPQHPRAERGSEAPRLVVEVLDADGAVVAVPVTAAVDRDHRTRERSGAAGPWRVHTRIQAGDDVAEVDLEVSYLGATPVEAGLRVALELPGTVTEPHWLVPGCFYRNNRVTRCLRHYPRAVADGGDLAALESPWWSFRSDRAAAPAVLGWSDGACAGLAGPARTPLGLSGMGFAADGGAGRVWLDFPYREEPVVYRGEPRPAPPVVRTHRWRPGERQRLACLLYHAAPHPHAYDRLLREVYRRHRADNPLAPWVDVTEGAALTAHGLHTWHWRPDHEALYETAAFDRALDALDRPHMHVAWVSGVPWACALLDHGRRVGDPRYVDAATRVIDRITAAATPAGTFWGQWTAELGWGCGWNPDSAWLHARTLAEATLFTLRASRVERRAGHDHPGWRRAADRNLTFAIRGQRDDGNLGSYYHHESGDVVEWEGAAGVLWIAALVEGAELLDRPELLDHARAAGRHYASYVDHAFIYGAPEDVHLTPTSEDAYNALIAYLALHRADPDGRWLELARRAADWMMTFRWTYNVQFDERTLLGRYDFRTRGADQASPANQHLHAYGLVCLGELVELWRRTADGYYLDRARDALACFLQLIAREDGDFNARKGMVAERYYQTDCFDAKGAVLSLSHAWSVGAALHGCLVALDNPDAFPDGLAWAKGDPCPS